MTKHVKIPTPMLPKNTKTSTHIKKQPEHTTSHAIYKDKPIAQTGKQHTTTHPLLLKHLSRTSRFRRPRALRSGRRRRPLRPRPRSPPSLSPFPFQADRSIVSIEKVEEGDEEYGQEHSDHYPDGDVLALECISFAQVW